MPARDRLRDAAAPVPGRCRFCKQRILWSVSPAGRSVPLDPTGPFTVATPRGLSASVDLHARAYRLHVDTCPNLPRREGREQP